MLAADLEYYKPASIIEAIRLFKELEQENKKPVFYSGGTEILTLGRLNLVNPRAIIDIKGIPECFILQNHSSWLVTGSAIPLTVLEETNLFPLLSEVSKQIADHTARNKITLGGNVCGKIFYREAVLPFLLADSHVVLAGYNGIEKVPIHTIFHQELQLEAGQFLVQIQTDINFINLPYITRKKRQQWETGYPLIAAAALKKDGQLRIAFSGLCPFPFRSFEMEKELNSIHLAFEERIDQALNYIPGPVLNDLEGSSEYRIFVLKNLLKDYLLWMEEV